MESRTALLEEFWNVTTAAAGIVLSAVGLAVLVVFAALYGTATHVVSCSVFGATLILMYTSSTLYHGARTPRLKHAFKIADHACIYLLIAGTYTPFTLVTLEGGWGWTLFGIVWGLAAAGIVFQIFFVYRFKVLATLAYIAMGWLAVVAVEPLVSKLPAGGLAWLVAGGLAYTSGTLFYLWKRLPHNHAIWHLFVLLGSVCHYFAVMFYVVPKT